MNDVIFTVDGMHCNGCAQTIERALSTGEGVRDAKASFKERRVRVWYDSTVTDSRNLAARISEIGYRVVGVERAAE